MKSVRDGDIYSYTDRVFILNQDCGELVLYGGCMWRRFSVGNVPRSFQYSNFERLVTEAYNYYQSLFWAKPKKFSYSFPSDGLEEALAHFRAKGFKCASYNKHRIEFSP